MTATKILLWVLAAIGTPTGLYAAKVVGDTLWLPISEYKQEKLYDLEDEAESYTDRQSLGETLSPLDELNLKRLLKRIERLEDELE